MDKPVRTGWKSLIAAGLLMFSAAGPGPAQAADGIAMYGRPALPSPAGPLPYADPDAPKGGRIVFGEVGGFDSLNPFILKGRAPFTLSPMTVETLMLRSLDEPFTLYGLLAESVETDAARSWVQFTLREGARFSDGSPVTPEDVLWSIETLSRDGHPRYRAAGGKIASAEIIPPRTLRFTFSEPDRELPLILGLRPVLKKAQWQGRDFARSVMEAPTGSGPYVVADVDPGRSITYRRNPDWWARDLPITRGLHNLDEVRVEYFTDSTALFEAFKAGLITSHRELSPARWAANYGFPAVADGRIVREEIPHHRPSGMSGLVFNTRRPIFADLRVRDALIHAFNFEFINQTLNGGVEPRITSYFANSQLAMDHGPAEGRVRELLQPFVAELAPDALDAYALPVSDGSAANRANLRRAMELLAEAGWEVRDGALRNAAGEPLRFTILLPQGNSEIASAVEIFVTALKRLGIEAGVTTVDAAQFVQRSAAYDFDMTYMTLALSLSPGNEQWLYWGSQGVTEPGSRNLMGVNSRAAEAMIRTLLTTEAPEEFRAAVQALDRVLTTGRYVIPFWFADRSRIAHAADLRHPDRLPLYGDWPGFQPDVWWRAR